MSKRRTLEEIRNSIAAFDRDHVERRVRETVAERFAEDMQAHLEWDPMKTWATTVPGHVANDLWNLLGDWYHQGPIVGDETARGFCWCHGLAAAVKDVAPDKVIDAATAALMAEIDAALDWRMQIIERIDALVVGGDETEDALVAVVERVVDLGIWDAWYHNVWPAVMWFLDAIGAPASPDLASTISNLADVNFTSWSEPNSSNVTHFAEEVAWKLLEAELDAQR